MASRTSGFHQLRSGCCGRNECRYHWPVASSKVHALPARGNELIQLLGGEPSGRESAQTYQSRLGLSLEERDSRNQGWRSEVWLGTRSITTRMPRAWASATSRSKSSRVPKTGSTSQ